MLFKPTELAWLGIAMLVGAFGLGVLVGKFLL